LGYIIYRSQLLKKKAEHKIRHAHTKTLKREEANTILVGLLFSLIQQRGKKKSLAASSLPSTLEVPAKSNRGFQE
jgi:hypothetical protein